MFPTANPKPHSNYSLAFLKTNDIFINKYEVKLSRSNKREWNGQA